MLFRSQTGYHGVWEPVLDLSLDLNCGGSILGPHPIPCPTKQNLALSYNRLMLEPVGLGSSRTLKLNNYM